MTEPKTEPMTKTTTPLITLDDVRRNPEVAVFVRKADHNLEVLGYTEHAERHASDRGHHGAQDPARPATAPRATPSWPPSPATCTTWATPSPGSTTASPRR